MPRVCKRKKSFLDYISSLNGGDLKSVESFLLKPMSIDSALSIIDGYGKNYKSKLDEKIDVDFRLNIDARKSDQVIKSFASLPHLPGKKPQILVFTEQDSDECLNLGAKYAGLEDLVDSIKSEKIIPGKDFDVCICHKNVLTKIIPIAKHLGTKGMMPNIKTGSVSDNIVSLLKECLKGRSSYKSDKGGHVRLSVGNLSMKKEEVKDNILSVYESLKSVRPASVKSSYFTSCSLSTTMMPCSLRVSMSELYNS